MGKVNDKMVLRKTYSFLQEENVEERDNLICRRNEKRKRKEIAGQAAVPCQVSGQVTVHSRVSGRDHDRVPRQDHVGVPGQDHDQGPGRDHVPVHCQVSGPGYFIGYVSNRHTPDYGTAKQVPSDSNAMIDGPPGSDNENKEPPESEKLDLDSDTVNQDTLDSEAVFEMWDLDALNYEPPDSETESEKFNLDSDTEIQELPDSDSLSEQPGSFEVPGQVPRQVSYGVLHRDAHIEEELRRLDLHVEQLERSLEEKWNKFTELLNEYNKMPMERYHNFILK